MTDDLNEYVDRIVAAIEGTTPHLTEEQRDIIRDHEELALQFTSPSAPAVGKAYWVEGRPRVDHVPERVEAGASLTITGRQLDLIPDAFIDGVEVPARAVSPSTMNIRVPDKPGGAELVLVSESLRRLGPFEFEIVRRGKPAGGGNPSLATAE
jgi:hypothetical protein